MGVRRPSSSGRLVLAVGVLGALGLVGAGPVVAAATGPTGTEVQGYVAAVEPIRDGVNRLLDTADPLLERWRDHRLTGAQASAAMGALEQRFAAYTVQINSLAPSDPTLRRINAPYAHTYLLEDAYLRALAAALPTGVFGSLPRTAERQRAAIVVWRNQLDALGRALHLALPRDLEHAGRGDIAPSPTGS
ncbi:MAG TPA: hypothetical protein VGU73_09140 [Acidimicrobiia bacterium]|nr:hypothetical protein [Acidimicrobiia bacterium]